MIFKLFNSGDLDENDKFSFSFIDTGTYEYHCDYYPGMTGIVIVE